MITFPWGRRPSVGRLLTAALPPQWNVKLKVHRLTRINVDIFKYTNNNNNNNTANISREHKGLRRDKGPRQVNSFSQDQFDLNPAPTHCATTQNERCNSTSAEAATLQPGPLVSFHSDLSVFPWNKLICHASNPIIPTHLSNVDPWQQQLRPTSRPVWLNSIHMRRRRVLPLPVVAFEITLLAPELMERKQGLVWVLFMREVILFRSPREIVEDQVSGWSSFPNSTSTAIKTHRSDLTHTVFRGNLVSWGGC